MFSAATVMSVMGVVARESVVVAAVTRRAIDRVNGDATILTLKWNESVYQEVNDSELFSWL